jgi:transposase
MSGAILAIDLGQYKSVARAYAAGAEPLFRTLSSTPAALLRLCEQHRPAVVAFEACLLAGWVHDLFASAGFACKVANTSSGAWKLKPTKRKTDRDGAPRLAQLEALGQLPAVTVPDPQARQWRQLIAFRQELVSQRVRVQSRARALLVSRGLPMPAGHRAWAEEGLAELDGHARPLAGRAPEESWRGLPGLSLPGYRHLLGQIGQAEAKLDEVGASDERVRRLRTTPGVGPRTAGAVVAYLGDAKRFGSGKEVSAYAGLVPRQHQSGERDRRGRITRRGPGLPRKLLVECAWVMLRCDGWARERYGRLNRGGARKKQAVAALARKLLVRCWAMPRDGADWRERPAPAAGWVGGGADRDHRGTPEGVSRQPGALSVRGLTPRWQ